MTKHYVIKYINSIYLKGWDEKGRTLFTADVGLAIVYNDLQDIPKHIKQDCCYKIVEIIYP